MSIEDSVDVESRPVLEVVDHVPTLLERYGGLGADVLALARIGLTAVEVKAIRDDNTALAVGAHVLAGVTDLADGYLARGSHDPVDHPNRKRGARWDRWADRAHEFGVGAALVLTGKKPAVIQIAQVGREVLRSQISKDVLANGGAAKSVRATKLAAFAVYGANLASVIEGKTAATNRVQAGATALKYGSLLALKKKSQAT